MAGRIAKSFITELVSRTDIVSLIDFYVPLKKAGLNYSACCPFHNEKTPSFTVSAEKQFYHCFGCGAHGNAVSFLMEYQRLEFIDAVEELARVNAVDVVYEQQSNYVAPSSQQLAQQEQQYQLMQRAATFYQKQLVQHPDAIAYLKQRGLSKQVIQTYGIGYAPNEWTGLIKHLGLPEQTELETLGLVIHQKEKNSYYDRFRHRIMFPIHDRRGRVIAFGGRVISDQDSPKYLNSPETPLFHKSESLYGFYLAKQQNRHLDSLIIVEGYMDVVSLAQYGISNCIATLGTATTEQHAQRLLVSSSALIFCFDGDKAGKAAAWRALENVLPHLSGHQQVRFTFLPEGEDPDSMVRQLGQAAFLQRLSEGQTLSAYLFEHLQQQVDMTSLDGRSHLVQLALPYLEKLPDTVFRDLLLEQLSELSKLSTDKLTKRFTSPSSTAAAVNVEPNEYGAGPEMPPTKTTAAPVLSAEQKSIVKKVKMAVCLLVKKPELAMTLGDVQSIAELADVGAEFLVELIDLIKSKQLNTTATVLEHFRDTPRYGILNKLSLQPLLFAEDNYAAELNEILFRLTKEQVQQALDILYQKANDQGLTDSEKALLRHYQKQKLN